MHECSIVRAGPNSHEILVGALATNDDERTVGRVSLPNATSGGEALTLLLLFAIDDGTSSRSVPNHFIITP